MQTNPLDLHGYTVADAMIRFARTYNWLLANRPGTALEVIHGKGTPDMKSAIRTALRDYLGTQGKRIKGFDAQLAMQGAEYLLDGCGKLAYMFGEDVKRNAGCTIVVPIERIHLPREWASYS